LKIFSITGRGTVATGRIRNCIANTGDAVEIIGMGAEKLTSVITGVEMLSNLDRGAGITLVFFLRGIQKKTSKRNGSKPGSVKPRYFQAEVYILKKKKKKVVTLHSIITTVHSFTYVQLT
jgi:elongation factor Tu